MIWIKQIKKNRKTILIRFIRPICFICVSNILPFNFLSFCNFCTYYCVILKTIKLIYFYRL